MSLSAVDAATTSASPRDGFSAMCSSRTARSGSLLPRPSGSDTGSRCAEKGRSWCRQGSPEVTNRWLKRQSGAAVMECPYIRVEESGTTIPLAQEVTTVGRGRSVDVQLAEPSVSMLHAEIVCRGPYVYVTDLGLSRNGTRVNGRLVARRLLADGDVLTFGSARCRVAGIAIEDLSADAELRRPAAP